MLRLLRFAFALLLVSAMSVVAQTPVAAQNAAAAPTQVAAPAEVAIRVELAKSLGLTSHRGLVRIRRVELHHDEVRAANAGELHDLAPVPATIRAHHLFTSGDGVAKLKWSSSNVFTLDANGKPVSTHHSRPDLRCVPRRGSAPMVELDSCRRRCHGRWAVLCAVSQDAGRLGAEPAEGLRDVGRTGAAIHRAYGGAIRQGRGGDVVFRGVERAGHQLLEGHAGEYFKLYDYSWRG